MRVRVSKVMAKALNKGCHDMKVEYDVVTVRAYERRVDCDIFNHDNDFIYNDDGELCVKVLCVVYPGEYYAMPSYASTNDLLRIVKRNNVKTVEELCSAFQREYEI